MLYNVEKQSYFQLGIVAGGINFDRCGGKPFPVILSRLNYPEVFTFVKSTVENQGEDETLFFCLFLFI
jgi:hypothetical protein